MNSNITSSFIIIVALAVYPLFISPLVSETKQLRQEKTELQSSLERIDKFSEEKDNLLKKRNQFTDEEVKRLEEILPGTMNRLQFALDMQQLALSKNLVMTGSVDVKLPTSQVGKQTASTQNNQKVVLFSTSFTGTFQEMIDYLEELSESLTLIDVVSLSFSSPSEGSGNLYNFILGIQTYLFN